MSYIADSDKSDAWIKKVVTDYPVTLIKTKDGTLTGNIRTCPVRLSFPWVFKEAPPMRNADGSFQKSKFMTTLMHPSCADVALYDAELDRVIKERFPAYKNGMKGYDKSLHDGGEKTQLQGYDEGCCYFAATSNEKPKVVDANGAPLVDESRVYPGVWAICVVRPFAYPGKNSTGPTLKKGGSFGLQSLMIIADDKRLGGARSDPSQDFAGVSIDAGVNVDELMA